MTAADPKQRSPRPANVPHAGKSHRSRRLVDVATVQNRFNLARHAADEVLTEREADGLGSLPWAPIAMGGQLTAW